VLDKKGVAPAKERSSRKDPLSDDDVRALLLRVKTVIVAQGKKARTMKASEAALDDFKGPTGNYRAPMVLAGKTLLVGFHPESLEELVG